MHPTRRAVLAGGLGLAATAAAAPLPSADDPLFEVLDAVGPMLADAFDPRRALAAMQALMALEPEARVAALQRYVRARTAVPDGMFAVVRALIEIPPADAPMDGWPGVLQPGVLRPPALGAPSPPQPRDLTRVPRWPVILVADVPLTLVRGYLLGGLPEPLSMHLDGLAGATWRTRPLQPGGLGVVRVQLMQRFSGDSDALQLLEGQLGRLS